MAEKTGIDGTIKDWVLSYSDDLYRWAYYKTSDKETAQDLVQETYYAALKSLEKYEQKSSPKTWLFSILKNKILDFHRQRFRGLASSASAEQDEQDVVITTFFRKNGSWKIEERPCEWNQEENILDDMEFQNTLDGCMDKLPEKWFSAIQLKYLEAKDGAAICQELNITPSNFWQVLHRAKLHLRQCLESNWFKN